MSDSLLDQALLECRYGVVELREGSARRAFEARLGVLERATWTLPLEPAAPEQVLRLVRAVLDLRDEIDGARRSAWTLDADASGS